LVSSSPVVGIRFADVPYFIAAQTAGALFATYRFARLVPELQKEAQEVVVLYHPNDLRE
jgi:hypothetical protein